jgi:integrase
MPDLPTHKTTMNNVAAVDGKQTDYKDSGPRRVPGLGLRVSPTGTKSWVLIARRPGMKNPSRYTLGSYVELELTDARETAIEFKRMLRDGIDPLAERTAKRAAAAAARLDVIDDIIGAFAKHCETTNRTGVEQASMLHNDVLPHWKGRNIKTITRRDVRTVVEIKKKSAPIRANRLLTLIKTFFSWAIDKDLIEANPARDVKRVTREISRDRVLTDQELLSVWNAAGDVGAPFGTITHLLLLTAQRRDEVAGMRWSELDLDAGDWVIPATRNKNGVENRVPLTKGAVRIIETQLKIDGSDFVFPSGRSPITKHVSGFSRAKKRLDKISDVTDWRLHDLRRTVASGMARYQIAPHVVEKLLNHVSGILGGVAGVYNRFGYDKEKRHALETWAAHLDGVINGEKSDNVVPLVTA